MASNFNSFNSFYPMNKIFKYILGIIPLLIGVSFCNAEIIGDTTPTTQSYNMVGSNITTNWKICVMTPWNNGVLTINWTNTNMTAYKMYCFSSWTTFTIKHSNYWSDTLYKYDFTNIFTWGNCPTCPTCEEQYTSLECQTEYSLIPISSVNANYCHVNFWLIDPMECPISEWSWTIQWSALYINNLQYASTDNINISIPEDIAWSLDYNNDDTDIDIEWYNADTTYIENVIWNTELTPTAEDMTTLVNWLQAYLPYFFIWLIMLFFIWLVKKFFRL